MPIPLLKKWPIVLDSRGWISLLRNGYLPKFVSSTNPEGRDPVKAFDARSRSSKFVNFEIEDGIVPSRWFESSRRWTVRPEAGNAQLA
mmetsp:Transcript_962/g.2358  ORF Transcript_962/g.2358 Transcript_962/m.2358 type:complete len:88 (+) Transcript_962:483-746(+)